MVAGHPQPGRQGRGFGPGKPFRAGIEKSLTGNPGFSRKMQRFDVIQPVMTVPWLRFECLEQIGERGGGLMLLHLDDTQVVIGVSVMGVSGKYVLIEFFSLLETASTMVADGGQQCFFSRDGLSGCQGGGAGRVFGDSG